HRGPQGEALSQQRPEQVVKEEPARREGHQRGEPRSFRAAQQQEEAVEPIAKERVPQPPEAVKPRLDPRGEEHPAEEGERALGIEAASPEEGVVAEGSGRGAQRELSRVISTIVRRKPSFWNSAWARSFCQAERSTSRGAPRASRRSMAAVI